MFLRKIATAVAITTLSTGAWAACSFDNDTELKSLSNSFDAMKAVTDAMAKLRSENMIELVAIDLGVIITYGSCLEFAEQCYQKSLIFPCQNRKFIKWLNIEPYIGIGQKKSQKLGGFEIGEYDWIRGNRPWSHHKLCFVPIIV